MKKRTKLRKENSNPTTATVATWRTIAGLKLYRKSRWVKIVMQNLNNLIRISFSFECHLRTSPASSLETLPSHLLRKLLKSVWRTSHQWLTVSSTLKLKPMTHFGQSTKMSSWSRLKKSIRCLGGTSSCSPMLQYQHAKSILNHRNSLTWTAKHDLSLRKWCTIRDRRRWVFRQATIRRSKTCCQSSWKNIQKWISANVNSTKRPTLIIYSLLISK